MIILLAVLETEPFYKFEIPVKIDFTGEADEEESGMCYIFLCIYCDNGILFYISYVTVQVFKEGCWNTIFLNNSVCFEWKACFGIADESPCGS